MMNIPNLSFSLFQAVTPPVVLFSDCRVLVQLTSRCDSLILVRRGVLSWALCGKGGYHYVNDVNKAKQWLFCRSNSSGYLSCQKFEGFSFPHTLWLCFDHAWLKKLKETDSICWKGILSPAVSWDYNSDLVSSPLPVGTPLARIHQHGLLAYQQRHQRPHSMAQRQWVYHWWHMWHVWSVHQKIKETLTKPYMALKFIKFQ